VPVSASAIARSAGSEPGPAGGGSSPARPVAAGVRNLEGVQPVEGHGTEPSESHAGRVRPAQRPGHHFEQRSQRTQAQAAFEIIFSRVSSGEVAAPVNLRSLSLVS
jgi:hypothetical protein